MSWKEYLILVVFSILGLSHPAVAKQDAAAGKAVSSSVSSVRKMTYGVCELFYATETNRDAADDSSINSLSASSYMLDFLQPDLREQLSTPYGASGETLEWSGKWEAELKITVLRGPAHGKFVNVKNVPSNQYLPNKGYLGPDRIELLVEGSDDLQRPIAMTLRYFINVVPRTELQKISGRRHYWRMIKKYCGTSTKSWRISSFTGGSGVRNDP